MNNKLNKYHWALFIFISCVFVYLSNLLIDISKDKEHPPYRNLMPAADVIPNTFLPYQLLNEGTFKFTSVRKHLRLFDGGNKNPYFFYNNARGDTYSVYPVIEAFFALPVYAPVIWLHKIGSFVYPKMLIRILVLGRITATIYTAMSVVIMYFLLKHKSRDKFLLFTFLIAYAFGTQLYSVSSRGMWQHTFSLFLFSILLFYLVNPKFTAKYAALVGFLFASLFMVRATNAVILVFLGIYLLKNFSRKNFIVFLLSFIALYSLQLIYNFNVFGGVFSEGYGARNDFHWTTSYLTSLPAYFVSPGRGLLFLSPLLLFSFAEIYALWKDKQEQKDNNFVFRLLSLGIFAFILVFGKWYTWSGANAFGNRMFTDIVPFLGYFSFLWLSQKYSNKKWQKILLALLVLYSVYVHTNAVWNLKSRCSKEHDWDFTCLKLKN